MSEGNCASCGRVVAECSDFCDVQIVWRAVLFLGQKGRLWVLFRLLVVGVRIRILIPILWKKQFYKHLSLPYCTIVCVVVLSPRGRPLKHAPATMNLALLHRSLRPVAANNAVSCRCMQRPKYQHSGRVERPVAWSRPGKGGANALELEQQRKWETERSRWSFAALNSTWPPRTPTTCFVSMYMYVGSAQGQACNDRGRLVRATTALRCYPDAVPSTHKSTPWRSEPCGKLLPLCKRLLRRHAPCLACSTHVRRPAPAAVPTPVPARGGRPAARARSDPRRRGAGKDRHAYAHTVHVPY